MNFTNLLLFTIASLLGTAHGWGMRGAPQIQRGPIMCRVFEIDVMHETSNLDFDHQLLEDEDHPEPEFKCMIVDNLGHSIGSTMYYSLNITEAFYQQHPHLANGKSLVQIPDARAVWNPNSNESPYIDYPSNAMLQVVKFRKRSQRRLNEHKSLFHDKAHGNKTALVIRVTTADGEVKTTKETLSSNIFGIGDNVPTNTVTSQYLKCSFDKLNILPAQGPSIVNGVMEVSIPVNNWNVNPEHLEPYVNEEAQRILNVTNIDDLFDHILIVYPLGTLRLGHRPEWDAWASIGGKRSYYNNDHAEFMSVVIHELGHNLGFYHSEENGRPFGDTSGLMGSSYRAIGKPDRCFNGYKNWLLGWYQDKTLTVDIYNGAWGGNISAFVDYDLETSENVIVKVGDYYLQYNRQSKMNKFTGDFPDQVTIVQGVASDAPSKLLGAVSDIAIKEHVHRIANFQGSGHDLVIESCDGQQNFQSRVDKELPDLMGVSIYLDDGHQSSTCSQSATPAPTASSEPTGSPTTTQSPVAMPTEPTASPSSSPVALSTTKPTGCDDSETNKFFVNDLHGEKNCDWLKKHRSLIRTVCNKSDTAKNSCMKTCGTCNKLKCGDSQSTEFYINDLHGEKNCAWLKKHPHLVERVCSATANGICKETCGQCSSAPLTS